MVLRQCSVGGKAYRGDPEVLTDGEDEGNKNSDSIELEKDLLHEPITRPIPLYRSSIDAGSTNSHPPGLDRSSSTPKTKTSNPRFRDTVLTSDITAACNETDLSSSHARAHARALNGFFTVLGLCHTALASVDPLTGVIEHKAQSPDEAALVQAAADVRYVFLGRDKEILSLHTPSSVVSGEDATPVSIPERYELLHILEFSSARKRMSVIVRKLDQEEGEEKGQREGGRIFLLCKGADNVIFERLRKGGIAEEELKQETEAHLSEFANEGLRTLTLAYKIIPGMSSTSLPL